MWAEALPPGSTEEDYKAAKKFSSSLTELRPFSKKWIDDGTYTMAQMLSFIEARKLSIGAKEGLEATILRWKLMESNQYLSPWAHIVGAQEHFSVV